MKVSSERSGGSGKPVLIAIGFLAQGTGMTRVLEHVLGAVCEQFEIHFVGLAADGEPHQSRGRRIYPAGRGGRDVFGAYRARELMERFRPAVVLIHNDLWYFERYLRILGPVRADSRLIGYIPIDGDVIDETLAAPVAELDDVVVYTSHASRQIAAAFDRLGVPEARDRVRRIGHGVHHLLFRPARDLIENDFRAQGRIALKREAFQDLVDPEDSFIVLNAARPTGRKRLDITLEGFAIFAQGKPTSGKLCLHQAVSNDRESGRMLDLARALGVAERLLFDRTRHDAGPLSDEDLNKLYGACDVGLNTSLGEGWGLVSFEHGAAGGCQVLPRHTALTELWEGHAELMEPDRDYVPEYSLLKMYEVSPAAVADALERLSADGELAATRSRQAHLNATRSEYDWNAVADQWRRLLVH